MKEILSLDNEQLTSLIKHIDQPNWLSISAQLLIALIAAYSGYYFQKVFKKRDTIANQREGLLRFNETVSFLAILVENIVMNLEQLVFPAFIRERGFYMQMGAMLKATGGLPDLRTSFVSIPSIEPLQVDNVISKIPAIGSRPEIIMAFHRLRYALVQFVNICEERDFLIKRLLENDKRVMQNDVIMLRYGEVLDRTSKLFIAGESILNTALHLAEELVPVADQIKSDFKQLTNEDIKVMKIVNNPLYDQLEKSFKDEIDNMEDTKFKNRMLYPKRRKVFCSTPVWVKWRSVVDAMRTCSNTQEAILNMNLVYLYRLRRPGYLERLGLYFLAEMIKWIR